jgi:uncharacterized membrane protein YphA (DoxX/SURF4 family)
MESTSMTTKRPFLKRDQFKQFLITGITGLCIFLLVYTAQAKIAEHGQFYKGLLYTTYLKDYALTISWLVPFTELAIALLLIIPRTQRQGLYLFVLLMSAFTLYIASMLLWAETKTCHCGGAISSLTWEQHLMFNIGFILIAIFGIYLRKNSNRKINH